MIFTFLNLNGKVILNNTQKRIYASLFSKMYKNTIISTVIKIFIFQLVGFQIFFLQLSNILFLSFLVSCICLLYCGVKMRHSFLHNLAEGPSPGLELNTPRVPVLESSFGSLIFSPWYWALFQPKLPRVFLNWSILWLGELFQGQTSYQFSSLGRQHSREVFELLLKETSDLYNVARALGSWKYYDSCYIIF